MAKRIEVIAPSRIDLAGGWTDVPIYCRQKTGEVVNIAINQYVRSSMTIDDEQKITLTYTTDMPTGSGLGTSGAMNVGLISTIMAGSVQPLNAAEIAYQFEALLGNRGGRQDQWASALGGINHLTFDGDQVLVNRLEPSVNFAEWLQQHLLLFNSHITHVSGELHSEIWQRFDAGDDDIVRGLDMIRTAGLTMAEGITEESPAKVVTAMNLNSAGVDMLDLELHAPFRNRLKALSELGIIQSWKAMGAGGGGVVGVIISKLSIANDVIEELSDIGWSNIPWAIDYSGVTKNQIIL